MLQIWKMPYEYGTSIEQMVDSTATIQGEGFGVEPTSIVQISFSLSCPQDIGNRETQKAYPSSEFAERLSMNL